MNDYAMLALFGVAVAIYRLQPMDNSEGSIRVGLQL